MVGLVFMGVISLQPSMVSFNRWCFPGSFLITSGSLQVSQFLSNSNPPSIISGPISKILCVL